MMEPIKREPGSPIGWCSYHSYFGGDSGLRQYGSSLCGASAVHELGGLAIGRRMARDRLNAESFHGGRVRLYCGDALDVLAALPESSIDSVVTDPPYALVSIAKRRGCPDAAPAKSNGASDVYGRASAGFMNKNWDTGKVAFDPAFWAEVARVVKPGGYVLAFGGDRTFHRLYCAIEDGGLEPRHTICWIYGQGFPKNHSIAKACKDVEWCECDG